MLRTQSLQRIPIRDHAFSQKVRREGITNLDRCYQCYACSDCCPLAYAMDYYPNQLIHMVRLGLKGEVLKSKTIWICVSCWLCATRCPNEIDIVRFMDILRKESLKERLQSPIYKIPQFHKLFMKEIQKRGRINELALLFRYKLKTAGFFSLQNVREDVGLAFKMFLKGKLRYPSQRMAGQKEVKEIFKNLF